MDHRRPLLIVAIMALVAAQGCQWWSQIAKKDPFGSRSPCVLPPQASKEELVQYLNRNIEGDGDHPGLKAWRCSAVNVHVKGIPAKASAEIAVAGPRHLRLRVYQPLTNSPMMDLGSNDERFWLWGKDNKHRAVMTCAHKDVSAALTQMQMRLPFQPDWLMEVLGVIPFDSAEFRVERPNPNGPLIRLVADRVGPTGEEVQRVVTVNACHGLIMEHELRRGPNDPIARASLTGHYKDPVTQIVVPKQIRIDWFDVDSFVVLDFKEIAVNPTLANDSAMWTMPEIPGCRVVDIGEMARSGQQYAEAPGEAVSSDRDETAEESIGVEDSEPESTAEGDAPLWMAEEADGANADEATQETDDWQTPGRRSGRIRFDEFERPSAGARSAWPEDDLEMAEEDEATIRMQSQEMKGDDSGEASQRKGFFSWLFPARKPATSRPSTYSPAPSRSSWGRPRLGQE